MNSFREEFGFQISRLSRLWRRMLDDRLSDLGQTQSRWVTLVYLQKLGGGLTQKELANALAIESPTLVRFMAGLEKDRLIVRVPCEEDGRAKRIYLTNEGEQYLATLNLRAAGLRHTLLEGISDDDLEACARVFCRIRSNAASLDPRLVDKPFPGMEAEHGRSNKLEGGNE
ncbi:MarR family transcriptional regulator [Hahella ganghwensis]|uniref:MarR family transcriptional regulator n=1 Tax=Hahella ganghwensis TaxID=286420 RepID=UPI0003A83D88|nr:MarR family transcriptional regulator [Hahella ganghwensis]